MVAASAALIAIRISNRPADADHPYGHQKVEYFLAVLEGMMVIGAAAAILHEVYNAWSNPVAAEAPFLGMAINGAAQMTVEEAHNICDRLEQALRNEVGEAVITIHVEPEDKAKRSSVLVL